MHTLNEARAKEMGVSVMRSMTLGILQQQVGSTAPDWHRANESREPATSCTFQPAESRCVVRPMISSCSCSGRSMKRALHPATRTKR